MADETFCVKAIVLKRQPFKENDNKITVYSLEKGKMELAVRGSKKISSKLSGHIEPMSLVNIMVVRGKQFNYAGSSVSEDCYAVIKSDLQRLQIAGRAVKIFDTIVKLDQEDRDLFYLLQEFLEILNQKDLGDFDYNLFLSFFIFKFLALLGHGPELYSCVECKSDILPQGNVFDFRSGGLSCGKCCDRENGLVISESAIKLLRINNTQELSSLLKIKISKTLSKEVIKIVSSFYLSI